MSSRNDSPISKFTGFLYQLLFTDTSKMSNIRTITNRILTIIIVIAFILVGTLKLSARLSFEKHVQMQREFHRFATVSPTRLFGHTPHPDNYRTLIGLTEITCAVLLLVGNKFLRRIANHTLILLMTGAFFTHCVLGDPVVKVLPSMVLSFLIAWRHFTTGVFIPIDEATKKED